MSWTCELTEDAERDLRDLPRNVQRGIARALDQMAVDPFRGDVRALRGAEWKGVFRRRAGSYRILFTAEQSRRVVVVVRILIRSEKTYQ